jgi:hypothetical protein
MPSDVVPHTHCGADLRNDREGRCTLFILAVMTQDDSGSIVGGLIDEYVGVGAQISAQGPRMFSIGRMRFFEFLG